MKEIKYRAWAVKYQLMSKPFNPLGGDSFTMDFESDNLPKGDIEWPTEVAYMQAIGLTDITGKDIYEGDIVNYTSDKGEEVATVEWDNTLSAYVLVHKYITDLLHTVGNDVLEVVGNVYENRELLA